jgi:hypothetical protein
MFSKLLVKKYPFLKISEDGKYNYINFFQCGWKRIWKRYLRELFKEYNTWTDEMKENFKIFDVKEKYGSIRIDSWGGTEKSRELENILEMISEWTCVKCGKMPTKNGKKFIYHTKGYILPYCKKCFIKETSKELNFDDYVIENKGFEIKLWNKEGTFRYVYEDLGDWLKLKEIIKVDESL